MLTTTTSSPTFQAIQASNYPIRSIQATRELPSQVFETIGDSAGLYWFIDPWKRVTLRDFFTEQAPLPQKALTQLEGTPDQTLATLDLTSTDYSDLIHYFDHDEEEDITAVGTKCILQAARIRSSARQIDTFLWNDRSVSTVFKLTRRPFSFLDITDVNTHLDSGTLDPTVLELTPYTKDLEDVHGELGANEPDNNHCFLYVGDARSDNSYVRLSADDLLQKFTDNNSEDVRITVHYRYAVVDDREGVASADEIAEIAFRTGGDGVHEYVYSRLSGLTLQDQTQADYIISAFLSKKARVLKREYLTPTRKDGFRDRGSGESAR